MIVQGSGGMAKAVVAAFKNSGFEHLKIFARNEKTGKNLAALYGYEYIYSLDNQSADILVNVTPIGMKGGKEEFDLAFPEILFNKLKPLLMLWRFLLKHRLSNLLNSKVNKRFLVQKSLCYKPLNNLSSTQVYA